MLAALYDAISRLWSWRWPEVMGEITAVDVEKTKSIGSDTRLRLAVAYKFCISDDGPFTGESFWNPAFCVNRRVLAARRKFHIHHPVPVRYRPDDPSVNKLDRRAWQGL